MKSLWVFVLVASISVAHAQSVDNEILGLWAFEKSFAPRPENLKLTREGAEWRAVLGSAEARAPATSDAIRIMFADRGRFEGALSKDGRTIEGSWVRPGPTIDPRYPADASQGFASPVILKAAGKGVWEGSAGTFQDPFRLYLRISEDDKGELERGHLIGAFRDPEQNQIGGATLYLAQREGDVIHFTRRFDEKKPEIRHTATLLYAPDRLRLQWPPFNGEIELTRATPEQIARALPRPPGEPPYSYRAPPATDDGWKTARAADVGIDEAALTRVVKKIAESDPFERRPSLIHSLLVAHKGKLVLEEYFFGFDRDTPHDLRSAGKTFASVMLGAAMRKGEKIAPETKTYEILAAKGPFANPDPRKAKITLAHLMTHTSGLACNDNDDNSPGNEDKMQAQTGQPDWWKYTLDLPMAHEPGARYAYCSANMNLVGAALTTATHTWLPEFFARTIARPLQFQSYHWKLMPTGEGYLGGGARLRPRDLLKVGQAYLDGGVWNGRRIVDAAWVKRSTAAQLRITPATTGLSPEEFADAYFEADEGLAWHLSSLVSPKGRHFAYNANGNGGQILLVVPEFDLAVVFTGGNYRQGVIWTRWSGDIVGGEIIPAIRH